MTQLFGTKAETLALLRGRGFSVPSLFFFEREQWLRQPDVLVEAIGRQFPDETLAVRSSARSEDTDTTSMAGAFLSILHVPSSGPALHAAIDEVVARLNDDIDQVLIQPMVREVQVAGVIMTRALDDGSPYYVFNYDDVSGRTDTVTGGSMATKVVHVYKGVNDEDFRSPRLREGLRLARALEELFGSTPLDIEFAVDAANRAWLLQVRPICSSRHWKPQAAAGVSECIRHVETYVRMALQPRPGFYGKRAIFGVMPDWNPAEIIGLVPRPLASSLYRAVITRDVWSTARCRMGYHPVPPTDLMISLAGRPYIDVRASFNSFLPAGLPATLAERLVNAWLDRLEAHPELHDKVEFEVVPTVLDFDTETTIRTRFEGLLTEDEIPVYLTALRTLTLTALNPEHTLPSGSPDTLNAALAAADSLLQTPLPPLPPLPVATACRTDAESTASGIVLQLPALLDDCRTRGTLPFAMAARHAFMAESLLRSAVRCGALSAQRLEDFKRSIKTVSGELSHDFAAACRTPDRRAVFLERYGHLRPGTYDILSPCYARRTDLFAVQPAGPDVRSDAGPDADHTPENLHALPPFALTSEEAQAIADLLHSAALHVLPEQLLAYARQAIAGREYIKFVFTRHLSHILELLAVWGQCLRLSRAQVAMIPLDAILDTLYAPLPAEPRSHFLGIIRRQQQLHDLASSFKLAHTICSPRDVYIAPMLRSAPNFITTRRVQAPVVPLSAEDTTADLAGRIVCIESADPGYDWIFTRRIAGLITRFGGSNSHMAIRCAEYGLPAAIGCGTILFEHISTATACILDCGGKTLHPLGGHTTLV